MSLYFTKYDMKRMEMYSNKLVDYHLIMDMLPNVARLYFTGKMSDVKLSVVQQVREVSVVLHVLSVISLRIAPGPSTCSTMRMDRN